MGGAGLRSFKFLYDFGVFEEELFSEYSELFQSVERIFCWVSRVGPVLALSVSFFLLLAKPAFKKYQGLESRFRISKANLQIPKTASRPAHRLRSIAATTIAVIEARYVAWAL